LKEALNQKEPDAFASGSFIVLAQNGNVAGLRTLRSFFDSEFDLLAFLQVTVAVTLDGGEVNENVRSTFASNEAEALVAVEPFHCSDNSFRHVLPPMAIEVL